MMKHIILIILLITNISYAGFQSPPPDRDKTYDNSVSGLKFWTSPFIRRNVSDPTKFDILAGNGFIINNDPTLAEPRKEFIEWGDIIGIADEYLTTDIRTVISIDRDVNVFQSQENINTIIDTDRIVLGVSVHFGKTIIESIEPIPLTTYNHAHRSNHLESQMNIVVGNGSLIIPNFDGTFKRTAGNIFGIGRNYQNDQYDADSVENDEVSPQFFFRARRNPNADGVIIYEVGFSPETTKWDNNTGVGVDIPDEKPWCFTKVLVGATTGFVVTSEPQRTFASRAQALAAAQYDQYQDPFELDGNTYLATFVYKKNETFATTGNFLVFSDFKVSKRVNEYGLQNVEFFDDIDYAAKSVIYNPQTVTSDVAQVTGNVFYHDENWLRVNDGDEWHLIHTNQMERCSLRASSTQNIPSGVWTPILFNSEDIDSNDMSNGGATININQGGEYIVHPQASVEFALNKIYGSKIMLNDTTTLNYRCTLKSNDLLDEICLSPEPILFKANAGDYLKYYVYQNSGSDKDLYNHYKTHITVKREF